jgi:hypothetical protein
MTMTKQIFCQSPAPPAKTGTARLFRTNPATAIGLHPELRVLNQDKLEAAGFQNKRRPAAFASIYPILFWDKTAALGKSAAVKRPEIGTAPN